MTDVVTVLSHSRGRLAKRWLADGSISSYDETKNYSVRAEPVASIQDLSALLTKLERDPQAGVIRGVFRGMEYAAKNDPDHTPGFTRKLKKLFDDTPHHWLLIEVDKFRPKADPILDTEAAVTEYITARLPAAFHSASYHWQLSNSAGHASNAGVLKVHLWFWLTERAGSDDLKRWATDYTIDTDKSVLNVVQFHYTAAPVAEPGITIPVRQRSGFVDGLLSDSVDLDFTRTLALSAPGAPAGDDGDLLDLGIGDSTLGWSLEMGRAVLMDLDPECSRAEWVKTLAAFHHEMGGSPEALAVAIEWSSTAANFDSPKDVEDRWASFGRHRGSDIAGGKWLQAQQREQHAHRKYVAADEWKAKLLAASDEFQVREKLCPQIAKDPRLDDLGREALAQMLLDSFKRLGTKYPIAQCRKLLLETRAEKGPKKSDLPRWLEGWVYVTDDDQFYRMDSDEWLSVQGFNARFNREMPMDAEGAITKSAANTATENYEIPVRTRAVYLPWADALFQIDGVLCVNSYRPSSVPEPVDRLSASGKAAVATVMRHLRLLCGDREEHVTTFVNWMAHNVQRPGVKIRWAPLIKGIEGDGKTVMGSLMRMVMGGPNVKNVSPKVLGTDFTAWATGAALVVLEEIKLTGHNRHDILNAVKPMITNDSIEVHAKGKDGFEAINVTNYVAFTNFADALPLSDTDRRWWVIFSPFVDSMGLAALIGAGPWRNVLAAYFTSLNEAIQQHPGELRRWLLDHPIGADFKPNSPAPMTEEKAVMIGMSVTEEESVVREILEKGGVGITPDVFLSSYVHAEIMTSDSNISLATTAWNHLLKKMGYTRLPKKLKWRGKTDNVWVRGHRHMEPPEVRAFLVKTLPEGATDEDEVPSNDDLF